MRKKNRTMRSKERVKDSEQQKRAASNKLSTAKSKQRKTNNVEQTASYENQKREGTGGKTAE